MTAVEEQKIPWTEERVSAALAKHHAGNECAFLTQVRNATGFNRITRTADAIAVSLWPSRGVYATGYEIKVSRADWKKELAEPEKAEEISQYCRHWFIAAPLGIGPASEGPPNWGLVEVKDDGRLKWTKSAAAMENREPTWLFIAAVLRNVGDSMVPSVDVNRRIQGAVDAQLANNHQLKAAQRELERLSENVAAFEKASGIRIDCYDRYFTQKIGKAVEALCRMPDKPVDELKNIRAAAARVVKDMDDVFEVLGKSA